MQYVSTNNSHLQAKLRNLIALQGGCAHLRSNMAYSVFRHNVTYIYCVIVSRVNPLTPNVNYSGRTAPLTSKRCIFYIYSTNIGTEYFKTIYTVRFFLFKMQFVS